MSIWSMYIAMIYLFCLYYSTLCQYVSYGYSIYSQYAICMYISLLKIVY